MNSDELKEYYRLLKASLKDEQLAHEIFLDEYEDEQDLDDYDDDGEE